MARYYAGNSLAAFKRTHASIQESTTVGRFDSAYVASAISIAGGFQVESYDFSATGTLWHHFELYSVAGTGAHLTFFNAGANAYRILVTGGSTTWQMQYWNTVTAAWVNVGSSFVVANNILYRFDLKIVMGTSMELFSAGVSIASGSVGANAQTTITSFAQPNPTGSAMFLSQVMGADFDTRDSRFMAAAINGNGTYTDGTGTYTDINETVLDESTSITLTSVGDKKGFTKAAITVPAGYVVGAMCISARGRVSGGTISDGKIGVLSAATYSASTGRGYGSAYEPKGSIVENDPATATRFTESGFNAAEVVVEAA